MVFSSSIFLFVFLPFTLIGYFSIRKELQNTFLLGVSLLFYAWGEPKYIFVMLASILLNYILGLLIWQTAASRNEVRKGVLLLTVFANLAILFYFKYYVFSVETVNNIFGTNFMLKSIALPIGISFFTFQGMSYVLDLYMGKTEVQKNPFSLALYISLFPQLIAGPIVRYSDVEAQIKCREVTLSKFVQGIHRFSIGLGKKVIIANQLGQVADTIFNSPANENLMSTAWLGIICYSFQIFYDFSGYSDMAIGLGKFFGFDFLENFNYPYVSKSITEFWRRWHISLSSWFRDYVYIPLGGNRTGNVYFNLLVVFCITGLWHGASFNFIFWGLWHGIFLIIERIFRNKGVSFHIPNFFKRIYTLFVVMMGWVLFRSENIPATISYIKSLFAIHSPGSSGFQLEWYLDRRIGLLLVLAIIFSIPWQNTISKLIGEKNRAGLVMIEQIWCLFILAIAIILVMTNTYNPFIYFRF